MPTKTVTLQILADAGDAQAKLDEAAAKADELDAKKIRMSFRLDDGGAKAQMDGIRAKADELGLKDVRIRVKVDGAGRALADLAAIRHEEDRVSGGGFLSRLGGLLAGGPLGSGGGGGGIVGSLFGPAGLAIIPAIGAALVEVTGLVSGFAAAGAGAAAFAALAIPAVDKVKGAYQGLNTAQSKYQAAQEKYSIDPTKGNAAALKTASDNLKVAQKQFDALPKSEQAAALGVQSLVKEFGKLSTAFAPQAFKVFTDMLHVANNLLPAVTPFANTFADSIDGLLKKLARVTAPPPMTAAASHIFGRLTPQEQGLAKPPPTGWQKFLDSLHQIEGPALDAIGSGIGKVAAAFGKLLTTMSGRDVAHAINIAFDAISGTINGLAFVVHRLMTNWDQMSSAFRRSRHDISGAFDDVRRAFAIAGHSTASSFDQTRHQAATAAHDIAHAFDNVRGYIASAFSGLGTRTAADFDAVRHGAATAGHDIAHAFDNVRGGIAAAFSSAAAAVSGGIGHVISFLAALPGKAGAALASVGSVISGAFSKAFSAAASAVSSGVGHVVSFLESLPGKIRAVFGGAGSWLLDAGRAIIEGLVRGIESEVGAAVSAVEHVGSMIMSGIKSVLHIGSPSKKMQVIGQQTIQGLIIGLQGGQAAVNAAAAAIGNTIAGPDSTISAAVTRLRSYVPKGDTGLSKWLAEQNSKLQGLAKQRNVLEQEIQQAEQVAQQEIQNNSIMNAPGATPDNAPAAVGSAQLISGMQQQAAQLKAFAAAVKALKAEGLNPTSLSQIISAGSQQGLPVAQGLLSGGKSAISQINALQSQIKAAASKLGDAAGPAMYQAGVQAGQGIAEGLKSQLGAISAAIDQLAQQMISQLKKDLKSHSPSLVFAQIGESIPQGVAVGIDGAAHLAAGASSRLAGSTVQPWRGARGGDGAAAGNVVIHLHGVVDKQGAAREIHQLLRQYKRNGGNVALGIG